MIAQMAETIAPATAPASLLLSREEVAQRLSTLRQATVQRGESWEVIGPTAERSWYRWGDGRYQENPSSLALAALSQAVLDIDIFALTRSVRCPLLFIGAIDPLAPSTDTDGAIDLMQIWRSGVQLAIEQIACEQPNVAWRGVVGDHILVPHQAAVLTEVLLQFMNSDHPAVPPYTPAARNAAATIAWASS